MIRYSHSRLSSFENCPLQYRYRYVDKVETDVEGVEAFMGKRVHEILERLYHHVGRYGQPPSLAQIQQRFRLEWAAAYHDRIRIVREENPPEFYREQGERCLENYYRSHYPFDQGETVGIEVDLSFVLDREGRYPMRGIVDRLVSRGDGRYEIHDYKTSGSLPPRSRLDRDRQLPLYQIAVQQAYPDATEVELVWHYLTFNRTIRSERTPEQLEAVRDETIGLIERTRCAVEFPGRKQPLCRWCEFNDICPVFLGDSRTAAGPGSEPGSEAAAEDASASEGGALGSVARNGQLTLF